MNVKVFVVYLFLSVSFCLFPSLYHDSMGVLINNVSAHLKEFLYSNDASEIPYKRSIKFNTPTLSQTLLHTLSYSFTNTHYIISIIDNRFTIQNKLKTGYLFRF